MVRKENPVYLVIGQDNPAKDQSIRKIKEEFLPSALQDFNFDRLYARELSLKDLQEKLLCLPVKSPKRIILIKNAQQLKPDIKKFIIEYLDHPQPQIILILDVDKPEPKDEFVNLVARYTKTALKQELRIDTFTLNRQIEQKKVGYALKVLRQLLEKGERPERILGGLRYAFENRTYHTLKTRHKLRLLLACDIDIKTGRLNPAFALEKLVVDLCRLQDS